MSVETMMQVASKLRVTPPPITKPKRKKRMSTSKQVRGSRWLVVLYREQGGRCYYCGTAMTWDRRQDSTDPKRATLEHMTPLVRGGPHAKQNCCAACSGCNVAKGKMTAEEFKERQHDH